MQQKIVIPGVLADQIPWRFGKRFVTQPLMDVLLNSFLLVAATEMGDKTQLLALLLVSRFRKPWTILAGILGATILNHLLAASVGGWLADQVSAEALKWILAFVFVSFAAWILIPDKDDGASPSRRWGAFATTVVTFFVAEMGDKTQLSTVALAAKYQSLALVTAGTTLGMIFSDGLAVFLGERLTRFVPLEKIRWISAALFVLFGAGILMGY